jgi:hypothetical protein
MKKNARQPAMPVSGSPVGGFRAALHRRCLACRSLNLSNPTVLTAAGGNAEMVLGND